MKTRVQKWGNSLAVRIPQHVIREAGLAYNTAVEMKVEEGKLVIQRTDENPTLEALLAKVTPENIHKEVETGESAGNEVW
ncbi:MAG: antitoxin [Anaerolineaceae bacterium]|nr:MAG: antitoxin [Anaerolineaceae bacterium]